MSESLIYSLNIFQIMDEETFREFFTMIKNEKKSSSYKFALLRATVEVSLEYPHLIVEDGEKSIIPLGLIIEKWILYYYPIVESEEFIPQLSGERDDSRQLAIRPLLHAMTTAYSSIGGLPRYFDSYMRNKDITKDFPQFPDLVKKIRNTIVDQPMKYLGFSKSDTHYSIFMPQKDRFPKNTPTCRDDVIKLSGSFLIDKKLVSMFKLMGEFIIGNSSLLILWTNYTHNLKSSLSKDYIMTVLSEDPINTHDTYEPRKFFKKVMNTVRLSCVWSNRSITDESDLALDHLIPFSVLRNNDFWNLLPSHKSVNSNKSNMIPSEKLLTRQKDIIIQYWRMIYENYPDEFKFQVRTNLIGNSEIDGDILEVTFQKMVDRCDYLVNGKGYPEWDYSG